MPEKISRLDKGILCATGLLALDLIVGQMSTGRPLHESIGIKLPYFWQGIEYLTLSVGMLYSLGKPLIMRQREIGREQYIKELEQDNP